MSNQLLEDTMGPLLNIATKAALSAGKIITRFYEQLPDKAISLKDDRSLITKVDHDVEAELIEQIHQAYPNHGIISEEREAIPGDDYTWIIDPLDGTRNYVHNFPYFCISMALQHKNRITHAVIYDPIHQDLFTAARGKGAQLNNRRIRVSTRTALDDMLAAGSFPVINPETAEAQLAAIAKIYTPAGGIRHTGAAALDMAYVAAGRFDAFWENDLKIWDVAAGSLLIEEAGGFISDWNGNPDCLKPDNCSILATNPKLFKQLLPLIQQGYQSPLV